MGADSSKNKRNITIGGHPVLNSAVVDATGVDSAVAEIAARTLSTDEVLDAQNVSEVLEQLTQITQSLQSRLAKTEKSLNKLKEENNKDNKLKKKLLNRQKRLKKELEEVEADWVKCLHFLETKLGIIVKVKKARQRLFDLPKETFTEILKSDSLTVDGELAVFRLAVAWAERRAEQQYLEKEIEKEKAKGKGKEPEKEKEKAKEKEILHETGDDEWPFPQRKIEGLNYDLLQQALEQQFPAALIDYKRIGTRAIVVVYDGVIVGEKYAPGVTPHTPLPGWSVTKSLTNALIGIRVGQGKLRLNDTRLLDEWTAADADPRANITLDNLLRMTSGLDWHERYMGHSDATEMLFLSGDVGGFAASKALAYPPGTHWQYSSGTTNILMKILRNSFKIKKHKTGSTDLDIDGGDEAYLEFPRKYLFEPLGMKSAIMETDASGTFIGSSFSYATARDWARFGLLYLNDGLWTVGDKQKGQQQQRILPEGWVHYSRTPTPGSDPSYGAHFWLNSAKPNANGILEVPRSTHFWHTKLPTDAFYGHGFEEQAVMIIPSRKTVIVRLGLTPDSTLWNIANFYASILQALPEAK